MHASPSSPPPLDIVEVVVFWASTRALFLEDGKEDVVAIVVPVGQQRGGG
jgi:hypothetical protein